MSSRVSLTWVICSTGLLLALSACRNDPIHVLPGRYTFTVQQSQIPERIRKAFDKKVPGTNIRRTEIFVAGDRFVYYIFQFEKGGKLQEAHITQGGKLTAIFDVAQTD
jgi:hypothetical protein